MRDQRLRTEVYDSYNYRVESKTIRSRINPFILILCHAVHCGQLCRKNYSIYNHAKSGFDSRY
jgi:hypothetical protein